VSAIEETPSQDVVVTDPTTDSVDDVPTTSKEFDSILLTFVFPKPKNRRHSLRKLFTLSISSRAELYYLTDSHLKAKIPNLDGLRLVVTPYQEVEVDGQVAVTEVLQGTLYFASPVVMDDDTVEALIRNAFTGGDLSDYVDMLEDSVDPVLSRVATVAYGIPLGIPDTVQGLSNDRPGNLERDDNGDSSNKVIWIIVAVCGSLGVLGLVTVACLSRSHNGSHRYRRFFGLKENSTGLSSPTSSMQPQLIRRMQSVDVPSPTSGEGRQGNILYDDELPEGTQGDDVVFNDMQSDITSVYSYLDKTGLNESCLTDDHSYSIAPSLLVRKSDSKAPQGGDNEGGTDDIMGEDDASSMWSVLDGIVNGDVSTMQQQQQRILSTGSSPPADYSPESRTISPEQRTVENNALYIFNDDDALSFGSVTSDVKNSKSMNLDSSPIRNKSLENSFDASQIRSLEEVNSSNDSTEAKEFVQELEKPKAAPQQDRKSLASILRSKIGLSHVSETSEASGNTSRVSADGHVSTSSTSAKEKRVEQAMFEENQKEESTDEDSSLFMGPETFPKENQSDNANVLSLGEDNKVGSSDEKDPYRITPLFRGSRQLSEKEKEQLGIRPMASQDDSSLAESMIYPGSYAIADFRDDMSISTTGSRNSRKYSVATKASF
jgi:hypothetical protein